MRNRTRQSQAKGLPLNAGEAWRTTPAVRRFFASGAAPKLLGLVYQAQQSVTACFQPLPSRSTQETEWVISATCVDFPLCFI
ncbi:MAG: hypothetical protein CL607_21505 [Anaerolineaceae bacterium]|nr:hypothetical protein [Anaerolineaceae bacterium]